MSSLRLLVVTFTLSLSALVPVSGYAAEAAPEPLTEVQENGFKELDREFTRLETFLNTLPPSQPRDETRRVLDGMRTRAAGLRTNFDPTRFDEIRWEVNFEHQQMLLWLQEPRLLPLSVDGAVRPVNELTPMEKSSDWELLFDGRSLQGWRGYRAKGAVANWRVQDGALRPAGTAATGFDLITERKFSNFELMWEWQSAPGSNGGVKYFVTEDRPSAPGHEYQILDHAGEPNRARRTEAQRTGAFYDVIAASAADKAMRPIGKWNQSRLLVAGNRVEHWLNGVKILSYELDSPAVKEALARSKFKTEPAFGKKVTGHILLTYHPTETAYRSIKVRELR